MAPLLGSLLRRGGGGKWTDNFNRSGNLGSMSAGPTWNVITGAWTANGSRPTTATSQASNPLAIVNPGSSKIDTSLTLGTGDALYFRVQDASNWWRAIWEGYQTSSCQTCCSTCCDTCYNYCSGWYTQCNDCGNGSACVANTNNVNCGSLCSGCTTANCHQVSCSYNCGSYSCNCTSCNCTSCNCTYYDNYRMKVQKMVAGTLTTVSTGSVISSTSVRARAVVDRSVLTVYHDSTAILSASSQPDLASMTACGIGRGVSNYNVSALDDFEVKWS